MLNTYLSDSLAKRRDAACSIAVRCAEVPQYAI